MTLPRLLSYSLFLLTLSLVILFLILPASPALAQGPGDQAAGPIAAPRLTEAQAVALALNKLGEIGANDFRISDMGPDGDTSLGGGEPAVAYNSADNEYLVVWTGRDVPGDSRIYGQRIDAATGAEVGLNDFQISSITGTHVAIAYNSTDNQYLVVWWGGIGPVNELEISGQRLDASGTEIGAGDFRISDMGTDEDMSAFARVPAVTYNSAQNEYLVVWFGTEGGYTNVEIYGQRLAGATGAEVGTNDFRISDMGPDSGFIGAELPAVAYNSVDNEYLVAWIGDDDTPPLQQGEYEIFGQRLDGETGAEIGPNDFRLSDMDPNNNIILIPGWGPEIAYNSTGNEYLVVWSYNTDTADEYEIFGQRVAAAGTEVGADDFRLSHMGPDGDINYGAGYPAVTYNLSNNEYLVVWEGNDNTPPLVQGELEIFGQRVAADGTEAGLDDFRLSDMGPDGDPNYWAGFPAVASNSSNGEYLVVWGGDDNIPPLVDNEYEVFGQRYKPGPELELRGNGVEILDGDTTPSLADHTDFGPALPGQALTRTFTLTNQGDDPLNLTGSPRVGLSGPGAASFSLVLSPTSPISSGHSTSFTLRFSSTVSGTQVATVTLASNDSDENPTTFAIQGRGTTLPDTSPPLPPLLIAPTGGITLTTVRPSFDWTDATDNTGVVSYTLLLTGSSGLSVFTSPASHFTPPVDLAAGPYTWTVIAHDGAGNSSPPASPASFAIRLGGGSPERRFFLPALLKELSD